MANNRMMIRCTKCGAEKLLAKRYMGNYYTPWDADMALDHHKAFNEFLEAHDPKCQGEDDWPIFDTFEISYQSELQ